MPLTLAELFAAPKSLPAPVKWARNGDDLTFLSPLDLDGVTEQGLFLRGSAKLYRPDSFVVLQLEARRPGKRSGGQLERLCWRGNGHTNPNKGPLEYRMLEIEGSHYHDFNLNINQSGDEMRAGNLRVAVPMLPEPDDFQELIDFCAGRLNIENLTLIDVPPWENSLLGGMW